MDAAIGGIVGIVIVCIVGLVIGAIAKLLMPGPDPGGWFVTILLGIAGSGVGSFLFGLLGSGGSPVVSLIGLVIGAMLLLLVYRVIRKRA